MRDARPWIFAAIFGGLWGGLESVLGTVLKLVPGLPAGTVMAAVGVTCLVAARRLAGSPGVSLVAGVAAVTVMTFSLGGLRPGSLVAVLAEATCVEVAMTLTASRWPGAVAGGAAALALTPLQKVLVLLLVAGPEASRAYAQAVLRALGRLRVPVMAPLSLVVATVAVAALAGAAVGAWAWHVAGRVERRLGGGS